MPFGKFSKLVLMFGLNGHATFEQRNNQNHRLSRWYAPRLQGDGTGSPTRALNYLSLATIALQLQMQ